MLKKAGIATAVATAALLAISPLAFADDDIDQERHQHSTKDNGVGKGNQPGHGNDADVCNYSLALLNQPPITGIHGAPAPPPAPVPSHSEPGADCDTTGESVGSETEQSAKNSDDKGGSYDKRSDDDD